jgi:hypothetical protein
MGIAEKSAILGVALTLALVAWAASARKSLAMLILGAIRAVAGLFFAPDGIFQWDPSATEIDFVIVYTGLKMEGTLLGAGLGLLAGWFPCWLASLPTDDRGQK